MVRIFGGGRVGLVGVALVAIVFVVGGLAGAAIDRIATNDASKRSVDTGEERSYVIDGIDMTAEQRAAIDDILERRSARLKAFWDETSPRMSAITDSARLEIMQVLTPEQRAEYERRLEERKRKRQERREREAAEGAGRRGG